MVNDRATHTPQSALSTARRKDWRCDERTDTSANKQANQFLSHTHLKTTSHTAIRPTRAERPNVRSSDAKFGDEDLNHSIRIIFGCLGAHRGGGVRMESGFLSALSHSGAC